MPNLLLNSLSNAKPLIVLVGRPNVGKSTLFNRLTKGTKSLVHDTPGSTRDRIYGRARLYGNDVEVVDTGGMHGSEHSFFTDAIGQQAKKAIEESTAIVLVVDAQAGIQEGDKKLADLARRAEKPVILAINKVDSEKIEMGLGDFFALGFENTISISAAQATGLNELRQILAELMQLAPKDLEPLSNVSAKEQVVRIAIVGKPNAGKSSLVNRLLSEERLIVSEAAGTTLQALESELHYAGHRFVLVDTAGVRRKRSIDSDLEQLAVGQAFTAIDNAEIAILIIDALLGVSDQDQKIAAMIQEKERACIVAINKWDAYAKTEGAKSAKEYEKDIRVKLPFLNFAPFRFISAKTGAGIFELLKNAIDVKRSFHMRIGTGPLNRFLELVQSSHRAPTRNGRQVKLLYGTQVESAPPTFVFSCSYPEALHASYKRYIVHQFQKEFGFVGTPLTFIFKGRKK
jgi:GTP-binding protein